MTSQQEELRRLITENKAPLNLIYAKAAQSQGFKLSRVSEFIPESRKSHFYQVSNLPSGESYKPLVFIEL